MELRNRVLKQDIAENIFRTTDDGRRTYDGRKNIGRKKLRRKKFERKKFGRKKNWGQGTGARHGRCGGKARVINGDS